MKKFALIGAAGYVAPRHMKAIKDIGGDLVAAYDPFDSVGIIDSYFPKAAFFTEFERFDRHIDKLRRRGNGVDYVSVCSPNYLHDAHIRFGLKNDAEVICEKPLVLNPWNIDALREIEEETSHNIYNILQLRLHPEAIKLKRKVDEDKSGTIHEVNLTYITSRGNWYYTSWKGDEEKSGGIATNIGVHFFDLLTWIFGDVKKKELHVYSHDRAAGYLELERANVKWFLSINSDVIPKEINSRTYRSLSIGDDEFDFSAGFTDLHTKSYESILQGNGYGIGEVVKGIEIVHDIRNTIPQGITGNHHAMAEIPLSKHPFKK